MSKQDPAKLNELIYAILRQVEFLNEDLIAPRHWQQANLLTLEVDSKDISFVALALQKEAWLWTGDKPLTAHLKAKGFERVLTTSELYSERGACLSFMATLITVWIPYFFHRIKFEHILRAIFSSE